MTDKTIRRAWQNLMLGILNQAMFDARHHIHSSEVVWFAGSEWCEKLCYEVKIDNKKYLNKVKEHCNIHLS